MKNAVRSDQDSCEPYGADMPAVAPGYPPSRRLVGDQVVDNNVMRHQAAEQETADPPGVHLPRDIVSEMETYYDERSEKWQEGDAGSAYADWKGEWEGLDCATVDLVDEPDCSLPDDLEQLPQEADSGF